MILLISSVFPPEPVVSASLAHDLAVSLSEKWNVKVLTPKPSRPMGFLFGKVHNEDNGFEQIILNSYTCPKSNLFGRMRESYSFGRYVSCYIRKHKAEIQCIYFNVWPLFSQLLIVKIAKKYSIPSIIHVQDIYPESLSNKIHLGSEVIRMMLLPIDKFVLRNVTRIIVLSKNMSNTLVKTRDISLDKIVMISNWQNENDFIQYNELNKSLEKIELENKPFTFMYLGNIGPVAGVDLLIESFAKANLKETVLIIAGSGSQKNKCIELAKSYESSKIEFWDAPIGKVPQIQKNADVMLLSLKKGASLSSFPSKLPAYMFSEKPIIASVEHWSDIANAIRQADCGWIVSPENTDAIINAMKIAVSMPEMDLQKLGRNGFNFAIENFSKAKNLQKLVNIIAELADC
jgi:glycosyltransferase involved in cell wall biosynthesis